jgi:nitroimidazol reductase NimA-like FMN-containing flavoprotein (pyridoxamine 5'-phosphate oxidase superfamily)
MAVPAEERITLDSAWESFMVQARMRKLSPATIYKYELLRRRMWEFAEKHEIEPLKDFDLKMLEEFQSK